jgi:hypothetical protein
MAETGFYRVENGTVDEFDLPLKPMFRSRAERGVWRRVNSDGSDWTPEPAQNGDGVQEDGGTAAGDGPQIDGEADDRADAAQPPAAPPPLRPGRADPKQAWVDYAVSQGLPAAEAEDLTKAQLVDRFGGA